MANAMKMVPQLLKHEGGFVNDPADKGGATMKGVTLSTFRQFYGADKTVDDLKAITDTQWAEIFKKGYWDKLKADSIQNQSIAEIIVDWGYNSGTAAAAKKVQSIVGTISDGIIGPVSLSLINTYPQRELFDKIKQARIDFYNAIVKNNPSQAKFLNGWMNRINSFNYEGN